MKHFHCIVLLYIELLILQVKSEFEMRIGNGILHHGKVQEIVSTEKSSMNIQIDYDLGDWYVFGSGYSLFE